MRYISWPDTPYARTGDGTGANDYYTSTQATIQTAPLIVSKLLDNDLLYTIGDLITYTVLITLPVGTTRNLIVTDTLPAGLLYVAPTSTVLITATPEITLTYVVTPSTGDGSTESTAILHMLEPINNTTGASAVLTWTMQLIVVDDANRAVNYDGATKTNAMELTYANAQDQTVQPHGRVGAGDNLRTAPAHRQDLCDGAGLLGDAVRAQLQHGQHGRLDDERRNLERRRQHLSRCCTGSGRWHQR